MDRLQAETALSAPTFFQLQEEEQYRLARSLSEGPGQLLANTQMELEQALALLDTDPASARQGLVALAAEVRAGLAQLKWFVAELQPPLLKEMGLAPSLYQYVDEYARRHDLDIESFGGDELKERLPSTIETAVFRIVQEALKNVTAHSGASRVWVRMQRLENQYQFEIEDNGHGFKDLAPEGKRRQLGLVAMRDRAQLVGGTLQIFSEAGKGLRVVVTVPYHGDEQTPTAGGRNENGRENQDGQNAGPRKRVGPTGTQAG